LLFPSSPQDSSHASPPYEPHELDSPSERTKDQPQHPFRNSEKDLLKGLRDTGGDSSKSLSIDKETACHPEKGRSAELSVVAVVAEQDQGGGGQKAKENITNEVENRGNWLAASL
jgi:hypothetical protein